MYVFIVDGDRLSFIHMYITASHRQELVIRLG